MKRTLPAVNGGRTTEEADSDDESITASNIDSARLFEHNIYLADLMAMTARKVSSGKTTLGNFVKSNSCSLLCHSIL